MLRRSSLGACLVLVSVVASANEALASSRNVMRPALPCKIAPGFHHEDRLIVKFDEAVPVRLAAGRWTTSTPGVDLAPYEAALAGASIERVFTRTVEDLEAERAAIANRAPDGAPPVDLNQYYRVTTAGRGETERIVTALNGLPLVETAYPELSRIVPLFVDIPPVTPLFESSQTYFGPAPLGLGWGPLKSLVGARAPDLRIGHLEANWHFGHEDASQMVPASVVTAQPTSAWGGWEDHGDAVAGILIAERNAYGVRGMSDGGDLVLGSLESGAANMISIATGVCDAGDVWVSSFAWFLDTGVHAPVDWPQAEFDAVSLAAQKGIVYCFGAGNSDTDLGDFFLYGTRYLPGQPESGGIIVGAGNATDLGKIWFSNYGSRVDCHAWGELIATIGYGDLFSPGDLKQQYTAFFGGTSGAGPLAAGIAAALRNVVLEQNGTLLTPAQVQNLLRTMGTPQTSGGHIGPRTDLAKLLAAHSLPDGLVLPNDGVVGQPATVQLGGPANGSAVLFVSPARGKFAVGLNRKFLLDPSQLVVVGGLGLGPTGQLSFASTIPNLPVLKGLAFFLQAATQPAGGGTPHLTNSAELWIRD